MSTVFTLSRAGHERLQRQSRILTLAAIASIALHVAAVAILPGIRPFSEPVRRALDVILVQPPVPAPIVQEPVPPKQVARAREVPRPVKRTTREEPLRELPLEKPVMALPEPAPTAPSAFTVPQAIAEPSPVPAESKPSVGAAVSAAPVRDSVPATPASFNAAYLRNAPPRYPLIARRNGIEGTVRLKVLVTRDGRAAQLELDRSSGSSALDNAALEAVKNWQFVPARRGQEPVESWVLVPVVFKLESAS
jgi:periplasmic protein TonB